MELQRFCLLEVNLHVRLSLDLDSRWKPVLKPCLVSRYANVTIGLSCILERTSYTGYNHDNTLYNVTVSRDNCLSTWPKLYCGSTTSICEKMKKVGAPCGDDRECYSVSLLIVHSSVVQVLIWFMVSAIAVALRTSAVSLQACRQK